MNLALKTMSNLISRAGLAAFLGRSHGGARDLYTQFGYPKVLMPQDLMAMYLRNGIANRIVRSFPDATWRNVPIIRDAAGESADPEDKSYSPFVEATQSLFERHRVPHYLSRADRLSGIGRYGVLVLGFNDGKRPDQPLDKGNHPLIYIQAYSELNTTINTFEMDKQNPRYGRPKLYTVKTGSLMGDKTSQMTSMPVHYTRVIHLAEFLDEDDVYGTPRLTPAFNHLMDLEKVLGSGAETFWLNARPGLGLFADADASFTDASLADMKKQASDYDHQLQRIIAMQGVTAQQFNAAIADPEPNISTLLDVISGTVGMPKRILVGSERGELSSTQDETNWSNKIDERRHAFVTPGILVPFIQKMIETGNLPKPDKKFMIEWPEVGALGPKEQADVGLVRTQMLSAYVAAPGSDLLVPPTEFRTVFLGLEPESEYKEEVEEQEALDEQDPALQEEPAPAPVVNLGQSLGKDSKPDGTPEGENYDHQRHLDKKANAAPRSVYIRRDVINIKEITEWAKSQGFKKVIKDLHVTLAHSRNEIDWMTISAASNFGMSGDDGTMEVPPGGARIVEPLGNEGAIVLLFNSALLQWRHRDLHDITGLVWDYPLYQPHITITYDLGKLDLDKVEPYTGKIMLGPEIFEEVKPYADKKNKRKKTAVKKTGVRK